MLTIEQQIKQNVERMPHKTALIVGDTEISYIQLWQHITEVAAALQSDSSWMQGKRVLLSAAADVEFVYQYFAVHLAGGICVPIDPDTKSARREYIERVIAAKPLETVEGDFVSTGDSPALHHIADILFTTGTTGEPKGVMLSHENLAAAARNINEFIGNTADDIELLALPVSHSFGLGRMRCVLSKGGTLVLLGSFANVKRFYKELERTHATGFGMVPTSWQFLKKMSGNYIQKFSNQLIYIEIGSAFMAVEDKQLLAQLLPQTRICMHYGLTEASRSAFQAWNWGGSLFEVEGETSGLPMADVLATAGKASPHVKIAIFNQEGEQKPVGESGEVCVRGEHVCVGYWNRPQEDFSNDFYHGYFRTGDYGFLDQAGYLHLQSRIKEMINVGGEKVSPMEVEDCLNTLPQISESACVAQKDAIMGEVVRAFIVEKEPIGDKDILDYLRLRLEAYKIPRKIIRINALPRTASGKLQRLVLHDYDDR